MQKSRAEVEEEKKQQTDKYFNYAENAVKCWIASMLQKPVLELFPDYQEFIDVARVLDSGDYYNLYLSDSPSKTPESLFDLSQIKEESHYPQIQKAFNEIQKAVYITYHPIIHTANLSDQFADIYPRFDPRRMVFEFIRVNAPFIRKRNLENELQECVNKLYALDDKEKEELAKSKPNKQLIEQIKEFKEKIISIRNTKILDYNAITDEKIIETENECRAANERMAAFTMHLLIEKNNKVPDNVIMRRLIKINRNNDLNLDDDVEKVDVFAALQRYSNLDEEDRDEQLNQTKHTDQTKHASQTQLASQTNQLNQAKHTDQTNDESDESSDDYEEIID